MVRQCPKGHFYVDGAGGCQTCRNETERQKQRSQTPLPETGNGGCLGAALMIGTGALLGFAGLGFAITQALI